MDSTLWRPRPRLAWIAACCVALVAGINALLYVLHYADPLVVADGWYFLDVFVRPALDGTLQLGDYFVKRAGMDHVQPLRKLVLLMELRWFDLDFVPSAVIGVICAGGCAAVVATVLRWSDVAVPAATRALAWAVVTVLLLSLNSTGIWSWPLVALGYSSHVLMFGFFAVAWVALTRDRVRWLLPMVLLLAVAADDTSILALCALLVVLAILWLRGLHRRAAVRVALGCIVVVGAEQVLVRWLGPVVGGAPDVAQRWATLAQTFAADGWWSWWALPLSNSVVTKLQLRHMVGVHVVAWQVVLGVLLAVAHVGFWWRFMRRRVNGASFFAAALMLMFYALLAGIIFARVPIKGSDYLNQPRYVLLFQFNVIALAIMFAAHRIECAHSIGRRARQLMMLVMVGVLGLQVMLSVRSWDIAPWITKYYQGVAAQTIAMGAHPEVTPSPCSPILPPCEYSPERRRDVIGLLQRHHLSVYAPGFLARHRLQP